VSGIVQPQKHGISGRIVGKPEIIKLSGQLAKHLYSTQNPRPRNRAAPSRTLRKTAVNECVKALTTDKQSAPDNRAKDFLCPVQFTDCPDCRSCVSGRLLHS
jgi:hypothetical protein